MWSHSVYVSTRMISAFFKILLMPVDGLSGNSYRYWINNISIKYESFSINLFAEISRNFLRTCFFLSPIHCHSEKRGNWKREILLAVPMSWGTGKDGELQQDRGRGALLKGNEGWFSVLSCVGTRTPRGDVPTENVLPYPLVELQKMFCSMYCIEQNCVISFSFI